jgi:type IV pilus assembly protein PilV
MRKHLTRIAGFGLIENLVAVCVVSVGLLGLLQLHLVALRVNRAALHLGQAVTLSADLAERLRANRDPADAYDCGGRCSAGVGGNAVAIADLQAWLAAIAARLPEGDGAVSYRAGIDDAPVQYLVTVSWTDAAGSGGRAAHALRVER